MHSILSNALHIEIGKKPPLRRYAQLWSQLDMVDGIVCRKYHPGPTTSDTLVVPVLPHQQALSMCHDSQAAGHQGTHKTLERIRREAYWVNMAQDVDRHCRECVTCQKSKLPMPGDGMVERFNRSLLQLLRTYVEKQEDWEQHLPLALTAAKMAELQDLVAAHIVESAHRQKVDDDRHSAERPFEPGDLVWLSVPTAGKLDLRWEGNWTWCTPTVFIYESSQQSTPSQESYLIQRHLLTAVHVHAVMGATRSRPLRGAYTTSREKISYQRQACTSQIWVLRCPRPMGINWLCLMCSHCRGLVCLRTDYKEKKNPPKIYDKVDAGISKWGMAEAMVDAKRCGLTAENEVVKLSCNEAILLTTCLATEPHCLDTAECGPDCHGQLQPRLLRAERFSPMKSRSSCG
ncbi:hypothetical protein EMCRGX_G034102 [Ephydatia muelleri]